MQTAIPLNNKETRVQPTSTKRRPEISVVVPISERHDDLREIYLQYTREISAARIAHEFIFVIDGPDPGALESLKALKKDYPAITVIALGHWFGEATALS